jgi:hypothetical protein
MNATIFPPVAGYFIMGCLCGNTGTSATLQVQTKGLSLPTNVTAFNAQLDPVHSGADAMFAWAGFVAKALPPTRRMTRAERKASSATFWALFE